MRNVALIFVALCVMAFVAPIAPVHAQNVAWVASNGSDSNSCSQTSPCATFAGAIEKGGVAEINCIDSGNYGFVIITGSIVIDCGAGNTGEMTPGGGFLNIIGIDTSAAATIVLRHLTLNGGGTNYAVNGIYTQSFASGTLIIEDCVIFGSPGGYGIYFAPSGGRGTLQVTNSLVYDNNTAVGVYPASGQIASVALEGDRLLGGYSGLDMEGAGTVAGTVVHSLIADNTGVGVYSGSGATYVTIEESSIIDNLGTGIYTETSGSNVIVGASTIAGNGSGLYVQAGSLVSFGNNQLYDNASNGAFSGTVGLK